MEASLMQVVAPMGCYSGSANIGTIQRTTQSFIHSSIFLPGERERKALIRRVLPEDPASRCLRAAVESHFYRTLSVRAWHVLPDRQKTLQVEQFIEAVRNGAQRRLAGVETQGEKA